MKTNFKEFKEEILKRAKAAKACTPQYKRAYKSETFEELMQVIKDNFNFAISNKVIEPTIIKSYENEFNDNQIYCNVDCSVGFLLVDNATVSARGNATVSALGNASVSAWGNASVSAWDNASVRAYDNASVSAWDNASVRAYDNASVRAWGYASVRTYDNAIVRA